MKTCSNCGQELNDDVKFCIACGAPVDGEDTEAEEAMVESYDEEDDREWYESDIFNAAISPLVASFDNGKFFLFTAKAVIDALVSIFLFSQPYLAYQIYKNDGLVNSTATEKTLALSGVVILLIIALFTFSYWMERIKKLNKLFNPRDEFVVIPMGTYLFQWFGEWLALILGIGGILVIVISLISIDTLSIWSVALSDLSWKYGVAMLLSSVPVVYIFRLMAEKVRALASIANNTKKTPSVKVQETSEEVDDTAVYYNVLYIICILLTIGFMLAAMFSK